MSYTVMAAKALAFSLKLEMIFCLLPAQPALTQTPEFSGGKLPTLAPLVREVTPSVVNIAVRGRVKENDRRYRDPLFREFLEAAKELEREVQSNRQSMRIIGPNCLGPRPSARGHDSGRRRPSSRRGIPRAIQSTIASVIA